MLSSNFDTIHIIVTKSVNSLPSLQLPQDDSTNSIHNGIHSLKSSDALDLHLKPLDSPKTPYTPHGLSTPGKTRSTSSHTPHGSRYDRNTSTANNTTNNNTTVEHVIHWKRGETLGQGAFGIVYLGLNTDTGELMAVKQIAVDEVSRKTLSSLENEIHFLRSLDHPNIVRYIATETTPTALSIFLEYVPGGSIKVLLDKFGKLSETVVKSYTRQLLLGLEYLHRHGIAHRDIKGANCLVGNDGVVKLADFGNSKYWRPNDIPTTDSIQQSGDIKGTPSWMAPEVIREQGGTIPWKKADIWSLACTTLLVDIHTIPNTFFSSITLCYYIGR